MLTSDEIKALYEEQTVEVYFQQRWQEGEFLMLDHYLRDCAIVRVKENGQRRSFSFSKIRLLGGEEGKSDG